MKIYRRNYDNPLHKDGSKKPNQLLGNFKIIETIYKDSYSSQRIGVENSKVFLITEKEIPGNNGGSAFEIKELKSLCGN